MAGLLKQLLNDRGIQFEYDKKVLNTRNTSNCSKNTIRKPKTLTIRQLTNRITKALPEANPEWIKEYLSNQTDEEFTEESLYDWITHFKKLLNE